MWPWYGVHITVYMALFVCVLCQPVHSCIEPSLHQLDFFLEIFYGDIHGTSCLCTLSASAFIEPSLHQLDFFLEIFYRDLFLFFFDRSAYIVAAL